MPAAGAAEGRSPGQQATLGEQLGDLAGLLRRVAHEGAGQGPGEVLALLRHRHSTRRMVAGFTPAALAPDGLPVAEMSDPAFLSLVSTAAADVGTGQADRLAVALAGDLLVCRDATVRAGRRIAAAQWAGDPDDEVAGLQTAVRVARSRLDELRQRSGGPRRSREAADVLAQLELRLVRAQQARADAGPATRQDLLQARWDQLHLDLQERRLAARLDALSAARAACRDQHPPLRARRWPGPAWQAVTDLVVTLGRPLPTRVAGPLVEARSGVRVPADRWSSLRRDATRARGDGRTAFARRERPAGSPWAAWVGLDGQPEPDDTAAATTAIATAAACRLHGVDPDGYLPVAVAAARTLDGDAPDDLAGLLTWSALRRAAQPARHPSAGPPSGGSGRAPATAATRRPGAVR